MAFEASGTKGRPVVSSPEYELAHSETTAAVAQR